jgi:hypothetical protein
MGSWNDFFGRDPEGRADEHGRLWLVNPSLPGSVRISDPRVLYEHCLRYFDWASDNALHEGRLGVKNEVVYAVPKMRPFSVKALCVFCGWSPKTWRQWRETREDLEDVIEWAESVIETQKFEGAAAGLLNASVVMRDIGLKEQIDHSSEDGTMTPRATVDLSSLSEDAKMQVLEALDAQEEAERQAAAERRKRGRSS